MRPAQSVGSARDAFVRGREGEPNVLRIVLSIENPGSGENAEI